MSAFAVDYGPRLEGEILLAESMPAADTAGVYGCSDRFLESAVVLPDLPLFYTRAQPSASFGTQEMTDLLVDAGRHLSWVLPAASPFVVGDISSRHGGYLAGHMSHRGGVDADVGIYRKGAWQATRGFTHLAPSELDVEATWMLISTMLLTKSVDFILLDREHIRRLSAYVLSAGLLTKEEAAGTFPAEGTRATWENIGVIRHAPHHQDHLHVRVLCGDGTRAGW